MTRTLTLAALVGSAALLISGGSAEAQTPPAGLKLSPYPACGYRTGSRALIAPLTYRDANGMRTTWVQHREAPAAWSSLGLADARQRPWYVDNTPVAFRGGEYSKYGLPRILAPTDVQWVGEFDGQGLFAEAGATAFPILYVIANGLECEFQPYMRQ